MFPFIMEDGTSETVAPCLNCESLFEAVEAVSRFLRYLMVSASMDSAAPNFKAMRILYATVVLLVLEAWRESLLSQCIVRYWTEKAL